MRPRRYANITRCFHNVGQACFTFMKFFVQLILSTKGKRRKVNSRTVVRGDATRRSHVKSHNAPYLRDPVTRSGNLLERIDGVVTDA